VRKGTNLPWQWEGGRGEGRARGLGCWCLQPASSVGTGALHHAAIGGAPMRWGEGEASGGCGVVVFGGFGGAAVGAGAGAGAAGPVDLPFSAGSGTGRWPPRPFKTWSPGRRQMTILPTALQTDGCRRETWGIDV
jgi:hypothetical protein